jgi:prepilin-type N-terminal cleavage/methylation domain-containing protein/prepilin-type processing-associated H-X9-DG protein
MKRQGFTLIELLVVIAIIALLMSILMPALARVKELANRVVCGANQSGIGKACGIYGNDDENGRFPRAGGRDSILAAALGGPGGYEGISEADAFGPAPGGQATIGSSLWLLVRGDYSTTKQFVCRSDPDTTGKFSHSDPWGIWDFGGSPADFCSYGYHNPYDDAGFSFGLNSASNPAMAVVADRNPNAADENSRSHQNEGQNVLFVDGHVEFERTRYCGLNDDDIYDPIQPLDLFDSCVIND